MRTSQTGTFKIKTKTTKSGRLGTNSKGLKTKINTKTGRSETKTRWMKIKINTNTGRLETKAKNRSFKTKAKTGRLKIMSKSNIKRVSIETKNLPNKTNMLKNQDRVCGLKTKWQCTVPQQ